MLTITNYQHDQWYILQDDNNNMTYAFMVKNDSMIGYMIMALTPHIETVINHPQRSDKFCYVKGSANYKYLESLLNEEIK